ncbi:MAG: TolC family protein [Pseudomonadota bacterium]
MSLGARLATWLPVLFVWVVTVSSASAWALDTAAIRLAVIADDAGPRYVRTGELLQQELDELAGDEFDFSVQYTALRETTRAAAAASITSLHANPNIDLIVALGPLASDVGRTLATPKPFIAAAVISAPAQGFPASEYGTSGRQNLHYLSAKVELVTELQRFRSITDAQRVAIVVDKMTYNGIPAVRAALDGLSSQANDENQIVVFDYTSPNADLVSALAENVDAVFILPQLGLTAEARQAQVDALLLHKLPSLSTMGSEDAHAGYLYGLSLIPSPAQLARRLAVDVRDIALGRNAADLPVELSPATRLSVNLATARALNQSVPFSVLFEAELLNEFSGETQDLTLPSAVAEALQANLELAVAETDVEVSEQDAIIARSDLLPQISAEVDWENFDDDLAIVPDVIPSETTTASLSLRQRIYSESVLSNYRASQFNLTSERASRDATRLDVIQETATAYLDLLIAKTERDIQRENVRLTRANLDRAQFRYRVGSADRSEVFRFEAELASGLQEVALSQSVFQQSAFNLNRVLRRPIRDTISVVETGVDVPPVFGDPRLETFISAPAREMVFSDFLTAESISNAPELEDIDAQISAQDRLLLAAKRRRYVPNIDFVASIEEVIDDSGASMARDFNEDWSVGVELSLPLYEGSEILAATRQARVQLRRLRLNREQLLLELEANARSSVAEASASRLNIGFAKKSEEAAGNTLRLITDSYTRGRSNYIDLIDAQNTYLNERLASAKAIYEYLLDLIDLQRAIGFFDFYVDEATKQDWFNRLEAYEKGT